MLPTPAGGVRRREEDLGETEAVRENSETSASMSLGTRARWDER